MRIDYLHTFLVIVETKSMAEAARRLGLTPAAVAQQIRRLEAMLDCPLLHRVGRTAQPTRQGLLLAERADAMLQLMDGLKDWVNCDAAVTEIRLGAINTALHSLLPETLATFGAQHPNVRIRVRSGMTRELYAAMQDGELDGAVCLALPFALPKTMDWVQLREESLVVLAPASDAGRDPLALLASAPFIRYERSLSGGQKAERYLARMGISPQERFEVSSLSMIALMVEQGAGVSLVPDIASLVSPRQGIVKLPLPDMTESRQFGVLWARNARAASLMSTFARCAQAIVARSPRA